MRYYFHLHNDIDTEDEEGVELPDEAAARANATEIARTMAAESVQEGHLDLRHFVDVTDARGKSLFRVSFGEAVKVRD